MRRFLLTTAAMLMIAAPSMAQVTFTPEEEQRIGELVREYLLTHPELLNEVIQELQNREQAALQESSGALVTQNLSALQDDPSSPVIGNPNGDVVLVEFFDYNCGYCRKATEDVYGLVQEDGNIKYVLKELPIFGADSEFAARAALASVKQGKYAEFHYALMTSGQKVDPAATLAIAQQIGLDVAALQVEMENPVYGEILRANYDLAQALRVGGTPAFVIGESFAPGWMPREEMERLVALARQ